MIELWGTYSCVSCRQAVTLLQRAHVKFIYVDVSKTKFEGEIPRIVLEDGRHVVGLGPINSFVKHGMI